MDDEVDVALCFLGCRSVGWVALVALADQIVQLTVDHGVEVLEIHVEHVIDDGTRREDVEGFSSVVLVSVVLLRDDGVLASQIVKWEVVVLC